MKNFFVVIVLGTGTAAQTVAYACREARRSVVVIDSRPFGGTCELRGYDPITSVAGMQGGIVAHNLLEGKKHTPNYTGIPSVVFTTPPLARVGLTEEEARAQGLHVTTQKEDTSDWYSSRRVALPHTGCKTLIEEGTG